MPAPQAIWIIAQVFNGISVIVNGYLWAKTGQLHPLCLASINAICFLILLPVAPHT
jgi:hypothetical protein